MRFHYLLLILCIIAICGCGNEGANPPDPPPYEESLRQDTSGQVRAQIFQEYKKERDELIRVLTNTPGREPIKDKRTLELIRKVPRHAFVTPNHRVRAYWDRSMPIGNGQTISQPYIVAMMMQLLNVQPQEKVLEIGTGSGYQAALLAEITPHVFTMEIIQPLAHRVAERLKLLRYGTVKVRNKDGYFGWPEEAPFDAIIVTAAAGHIPPPLIDQLAKGGRMVIPVGNPRGTQRLILVTKDDKGELHTTDHMPVRFVPMTGSGTSK